MYTHKRKVIIFFVLCQYSDFINSIRPLKSLKFCFISFFMEVSRGGLCQNQTTQHLCLPTWPLCQIRRSWFCCCAETCQTTVLAQSLFQPLFRDVQRWQAFYPGLVKHPRLFLCCYPVSCLNFMPHTLFMVHAVYSLVYLFVLASPYPVLLESPHYPPLQH